jgi:hypothetical protein
MVCISDVQLALVRQRALVMVAHRWASRSGYVEV